MDFSALYSRVKNGSTYNSILLAITQSVIALIFILLDYVFSKKLSVSQFGSWKELYFILTFCIPILSFGIPEGYKYCIAKEGHVKGFFSTAMTSFLFIALFAFLVIITLNVLQYVHLINLKEYYVISLFTPLGYLAYVINQSLRYTYINHNEVRKHTKITLFSLGVILVIMMVIYLYIAEIKQYYLFIGLVLFILTFGLPIPSLIRKKRLSIGFKSIDKIAINKFLKQGIPLYMATFIGMLCVNIDKGLVSFLGNKATFAIFSVGALEIPIFAMLSSAFSQNIYPQLVKYINESNQDAAKTLWLQTTKKVSYLTYPVLIVLMVFARQIITFVYSNSYKESVPLFQTYLLIGLFRNNYYGALIAASGETRYITYYSIALLATNAILSPLLYYFIGLQGIVWGTVIATVLMMILQLIHEKLLIRYLYDFLFDKVIFLLIITILITYMIF